MDALFFSVSVTTPIILMLVLGQILYRCKIFNEVFVQQGSAFIFKICLPLLIFLKMNAVDFSKIENTLSTSLTVQVVLIIFALLGWLFSSKVEPQQRGVLVQGSFHGSIVIIGLALVENSYGERANMLTAVYIALTTIVVSVQSILVLDAAHLQQIKRAATEKSSDKRFGQYFLLFCKNFYQNSLKIVCNPLIIATCFGLLYSFLKLPNFAAANIAPHLRWLSVSSNYVVELTLPLALICIGAKLRLNCFHRQKFLLLIVSFLKLLLLPVLGITVLFFSKVEGSQDPLSLGVVFFMLSAPAAATSFIFAEQMHGDGELAANIVASTTVLSLFTTTIGLFLLRLWHLV